MSDPKFAGKTVLVAGGTGALGSAVCKAFALAGANVVATYRSAQELESLATRSATEGWRFEGEQVDVTDEAAVGALIGRLASRFSSVDVIVNAVGGYAGGTKLWEFDSPAFDRMVGLNLRSIFTICRFGVPVMLKQGGGCIVNVASRAGLTHPAGSAVYAASKAAAISLLAALAAEVKGTGVRVNSILPDVIDTEANRRAMPKAAGATWVAPEEIASVILFLCSPEARTIHGASVPVYGS